MTNYALCVLIFCRTVNRYLQLGHVIGLQVVIFPSMLDSREVVFTMAKTNTSTWPYLFPQGEDETDEFTHSFILWQLYPHLGKSRLVEKRKVGNRRTGSVAGSSTAQTIGTYAQTIGTYAQTIGT